MPRGHGIRKHCRHCDMVETYRAERLRQEIEVENGGFRDETWRSRIITFGHWLRHYPWEPEPDDEEFVMPDFDDDEPWYPEWA